MKNYLGLPLECSDALQNVCTLLDAALLLSSSTDNELNEIGSSLIELTRHYSSEIANASPGSLENIAIARNIIADKSTPQNSFSARLKHAMRATGLTQKELAERAGVSQGFVSKLATGKTTDSRNIYIKPIADALGVSFGWLHYGTGEMYPANFSADNREV